MSRKQREIDCLVAEKVMGWQITKKEFPFYEGRPSLDVPIKKVPYFTNLNVVKYSEILGLINRLSLDEQRKLSIKLQSLVRPAYKDLGMLRATPEQIVTAILEIVQKNGEQKKICTLLKD